MLRIALLLVVAVAAVGQQIVPADKLFDGKLLSKDLDATLLNSHKLFPVRTVRRSGAVQQLPVASKTLQDVEIQSGGRTFDLADYLLHNRVSGLLILKNGQMVREEYALGLTAQLNWPSFSVAKSVTSTLYGAAIQDGLIRSLDDTVEQYLPAFSKSSYAKVTLRQLLQMASGVAWDETYTSAASNRRQLLALQLQGEAGSVLRYMSQLPRAGAAGTIWKYSTGETFVTGAVLEAAVKKPLATYLEEKLWSQLGMESDAYWWMADASGLGTGGGGLAVAMRDYARLGQFVLDDGVIRGKRTVPEGWFAEAGKRQMIGGKLVDYSYLWWPAPANDPIHQGAFEARGIFGQHIYINPAEKLVVVVLSARSKPTGVNPIADFDFFAAVAKALR